MNSSEQVFATIVAALASEIEFVDGLIRDREWILVCRDLLHAGLGPTPVLVFQFAKSEPATPHLLLGFTGNGFKAIRSDQSLPAIVAFADSLAPELSALQAEGNDRLVGSMNLDFLLMPIDPIAQIPLLVREVSVAVREQRDEVVSILLTFCHGLRLCLVVGYYNEFTFLVNDHAIGVFNQARNRAGIRILEHKYPGLQQRDEIVGFTAWFDY